MEVTNEIEIKPSKNIQDTNKFPLDSNENGLLPEIFDTLFENKITEEFKKGHATTNDESRNFIRKGVNQNFNYSFLSAMTYYSEKKSVEELVNVILEKLTVQDFVKLNNGNLVKHFSPKLVYPYTNIIKIKDTLRGWVSNNKDFINKTFNNSAAKIEDKLSKEKQKLKNIIDKDIDIRKVITIFYAFEYYKKYIGDLNISKKKSIGIG